ncbi:MAG: DNA mismatch repair protein MutS [Candidatus Dojkabacteria bacterium]|nr:DNA mismatch repair protein MutS [Candidatus Dojkabacteria bacterium]
MEDTPMMRQYLGFKKQYPDKILLYRMGDFFETFGDDAKIASKVLNITLTTRDKKHNPTPLAGFPHKAIDLYLPKLIQAGYCVVVVDQLEDPKFAKGIVKRGITRVVTPGTLDGDKASSIKNQYLIAIYKEKGSISISICDISTGQFILVSKGSVKQVLTSYEPEEVLIIEGEDGFNISDRPVHLLPKGLKSKEYCNTVCKEFFEIKNVEALDIERNSLDVVSVAMILEYIQETQLMIPKHIQKPQKVSLSGTMVLDRATIRNLELVSNAYTGDISNSLLSVIDRTLTPMGKRLLYSWIINPLVEKKTIDQRLGIVNALFKKKKVLEEIREKLDNTSDLERIIGKIGLNRVNARDFNSLSSTLGNLLDIVGIFKKELDIKYEVDRKLIKELISKIDKCISDTPSLSLTEGEIIRSGYNKEVDQLRMITKDSKSWIKEFEEMEKAKTGISSLKIGFNKVFGYYIEVTNTHKDKVPERYIRKQTLVNCERYITEELKEKENIILNAQEKVCTLEYEIFTNFRDTFIPFLNILQKYASYISQIDVLSGLAYLAIENNYCRPTVYEVGEKDGIIEISSGRHPLVESLGQEEFISNDTHIDTKDNLVSILTGPNMSGKSTYIRQVATIILLAQIGSFVPAKSAVISIVDRIFTRVGASDDLSRGRSTFMVEMEEAANIINNATKYSLIILDEVGRGTSTYDGVSIAWALAEYIVNKIKARTIFATHYHELLKLSDKFPGSVKNYNVLVEEDLEKGTVIFLRKIVQGGTDRSYGIYVAKMAGLPTEMLERASEILESFEQENMFSSNHKLRDTDIPDTKKEKLKSVVSQYPLFTVKSSEIEKEIISIDIDNMTPLEALNKIVEWKKKT